MKTFVSEIRAAVVSTLVLAVACCGIYPMAVWAIAQATFHDKANGSLIIDGKGVVRGSRLLGQGFSSNKYFIPRPSAAGAGYDATSSGGSNLGPTSSKLFNGTVKDTAVEFDGLKLRVLSYCEQNGLPFQLMLDGKPVDIKVYQDGQGKDDEVKLIQAFNQSLTIAPGASIPADAVTASASGLDPHISLHNAAIQAPRVAKERALSLDKVQELINASTDRPDLGLLGQAGVNVLTLNLGLDALH